MDKIKVGVIGVGFFGRKHAKIYSQLPEVELVAISDVNEKRAEEIGQKLDCKYFTNYQRLLDLKLDAVDIVIPDDLHREVTLNAIDSDKHILLEKPLAMNKEDCEAILEAARKTEKKIMVAQN